jgi:hypothetical protein
MLLLQGVPALVVFFCILLLFRGRLRRLSGANSAERWSKGNKVIAIRAGPGFGYVASLLYVGVFYWATPVFIWRYGLFVTLAVLAIPITLAIVIGYIAGVGADAQSGVAGFAAIIPLRALLGYFIGVNDARLYRRILASRGWSRLQQCH